MNNVYITYRKPEIHFFRKYQGYGISQGVLDLLRGQNIKHILIRTRELDYLFKIEDYLHSDLIYHYDGDKQKFVSITKVL